MGSGKEYKEMIEFITTHSIKPVIDRMYTLDQYEEAFVRLEKGEQLGKIGSVIEG